jgi:ribosomal protein S12 methylthiotransferase accessory factor
VHVPEEIVGFAATGDDEAARYVQTSDGLASGNVLLEAVFHGLCERVERDAMALWSFKSDAAILARRLDPARFEDPVLAELCRRIAAAGLRLRLYDATSDIGVPTVFALIAPEGRAADLRHLEIASGSGTHPDPVRAALRAVTEAAQTRLTTIAGARDDFHPATYAETLSRDLAVYLDSGDAMPARLPPREDGGRDLEGRLGTVLEKCAARGIRSVLVVPVGGEEYGVAVAKVIVADLEDKPGAGNRKPGRRALRAMMGMR